MVSGCSNRPGTQAQGQGVHVAAHRLHNLTEVHLYGTLGFHGKVRNS
jgi:hypothetical protein